MLSALQFTKGIKRKESTFLATLKLDKEAKEVQPSRVIQKVLDKFEDVMPAELLKRLPSRREFDHAIELESGTKSLTFTSYHMTLRSLRS